MLALAWISIVRREWLPSFESKHEIKNRAWTTVKDSCVVSRNAIHVYNYIIFVRVLGKVEEIQNEISKPSRNLCREEEQVPRCHLVVRTNIHRMILEERKKGSGWDTETDYR